MNGCLLPKELVVSMQLLAALFDVRTASRLIDLFRGCLFAKGKRTVASWLRAMRAGSQWRKYYYFLYTVGRKTFSVARLLSYQAVRQVVLGSRMIVGLDDTPTQRFGLQVEGAGIHRNPTPGPAAHKYLYGHVWVSLSLIAHHPQWGAIGLPLLAMLYVRQKDVPSLPVWYAWEFRTKLVLAAELVKFAVHIARWMKKELWVVADGFYAKRPFLKSALAQGATVVSRLRKDAALWDLPPTPLSGKWGRPRIYGKRRISLACRAGQHRGWSRQQFFLYREWTWKTSKTFLATWKPVGGVIRVVLVREDRGWVAFFCTDPDASVAEILGAVADRGCLEQNYHDLKEVHGGGQQQVRNLWSNLGSFHLMLWLMTLVELWAWDKPQQEICDRSDSPWDDAERRPSHADRCRALRRLSFEEDFRRLPREWQRKRKIRRLFEHLIAQAT